MWQQPILNGVFYENNSFFPVKQKLITPLYKSDVKHGVKKAFIDCWGTPKMSNLIFEKLGGCVNCKK